MAPASCAALVIVGDVEQHAAAEEDVAEQDHRHPVVDRLEHRLGGEGDPVPAAHRPHLGTGHRVPHIPDGGEIEVGDHHPAVGRPQVEAARR